MRVLFITDFYYTVSSGAKTSARAHFKTLQNLYGTENIDLIALVGRFVPDQVDKNHVIIPNIHNNITMLFNCLIGYSTYIDRTAIDRINDIIRERNPNVVFVDNSIFGKLIKKIKQKKPELPVLSYYHDVKAKLARDWMKSAPIYRKPIMLAMLTNEKLTAKYADVNFVLGDREEKLFIDAYKKKPEARLSVYLDIKLSKEFYIKTPNIKKKKILFLGGYYMPNVRGIDWFINNVYSHVQSVSELIVAGRGMEKLNEKHYPKDVIIKGYVGSIEELYRDADFVISPIFDGGGMKVKIAEAMAFGKIIIGSNESYEGYQEKIPNNYWNALFYRANNVEEFIASIRKVVNLNDDMHHFNKSVREIYENEFSEKYAERVIFDMINKCVGEKK